MRDLAGAGETIEIMECFSNGRPFSGAGRLRRKTARASRVSAELADAR